MANRTIRLTDPLQAYRLDAPLREPAVMADARARECLVSSDDGVTLANGDGVTLAKKR